MAKELNWFERHINWTWVIMFIIALIASTIIGNAQLARLVGIATVYISSGWALWRKNRSGIWILIPVLVLFLSNKRVIKEDKDE